MDPLTQLLMQRQMAQAPPPPQGGPSPMGVPPMGQPPMTPPAMGQPPTPPPPGAPPATPPNPTAKIPQQDQRFNNAQQLMESYRNGWSPNPMLLRAEQTK